MMMISASASIWNLTMSMVDRAVREEGTGNALFSPVSILTTLNMLLLGTTGLTRQEIITALGENHHIVRMMMIIVMMAGYPRYTADVHAQFSQIIQSMNKDIGVQVATSNALFHQVLDCRSRNPKLLK